MSDDYYSNSLYNDNLNKGKKNNNKDNKEYVKKKDKHWKNNGKKNKNEEYVADIMNDVEILRMQNLIKCEKCENIYHSSLKTCSYCKPNL